MKYEIFFLKNQSRVINSRKVGLMVRYQSINYEIKIDDDSNTKIIINSIMDKNRYLKKKIYKPKIPDCNIVRNKIVTDKFIQSQKMFCLNILKIIFLIFRI